MEGQTLVRHALVEALRREGGIQVIGDFGTIKETLKSSLRLRPNLVITDWLLEDGKATDLVSTYSARNTSTRFIIISGIERSHTVKEALDAGVHGFVMKRSPYSVLVEAIAVVLGGHTYYCPTTSQILIESLRRNNDVGSSSLTPRERDILAGIARGEPVKAIAQRLGLSPKTVNNQLSTLKEKLGIRDVAGLVRHAVTIGIVEEF